MQVLTAWLQDRKNLPIVLAGTGIVLVLAILLILKMNGVIGGGRSAMMPQPGMPEAPAPPQSGMPAPPAAGMPAMPAQPEMPGAPTGVPGAAPTAPAAQAQAGAVAKLAPMLPYRKDPFLPLFGIPKTNDVIAALLPSLSHPRLAPASVVSRAEIAAAEEVLPPQPFRRMSGVLWNGKVAAILETNGETDVVRPGMELTKGNSRVRVESIQPDCIILKTLDTTTPMTIRVNMAGSVASAPGGAQQPIYGGPGPAIYPGAPAYEAGAPAMGMPAGP